MASDAPDWQKVVTLVSGGSVTDAPDWQRTVTGPGAAPVGSKPWPSVNNVDLSVVPVTFTTGGAELGDFTVVFGPSDYAILFWQCLVKYSTVAAGDGWQLSVTPNTGSLVSANPLVSVVPGVAVTDAELLVPVAFVLYNTTIDDQVFFYGTILGTATAEATAVGPPIVLVNLSG